MEILLTGDFTGWMTEAEGLALVECEVDRPQDHEAYEVEFVIPDGSSGNIIQYRSIDARIIVL